MEREEGAPLVSSLAALHQCPVITRTWDTATCRFCGYSGDRGSTAPEQCLGTDRTFDPRDAGPVGRPNSVCRRRALGPVVRLCAVKPAVRHGIYRSNTVLSCFARRQRFPQALFGTEHHLYTVTLNGCCGRNRPKFRILRNDFGRAPWEAPFCGHQRR